MIYYNILTLIISFACVFIAYELWKKYGETRKVAETVESYPPEEINPLEAGFLYKGSVDKKSIVSLLLYLANKGYLKLEEIEDCLLVRKIHGLKMTMKKEYEGDNEYEKTFLYKLFSMPLPRIMQEVKTSYLWYHDFLSTFYLIKDIFRKKDNRFFETSFRGKIKYFMIMIILILELITLPVIVFDTSYVWGTSFFILLISAVIYNSVTGKATNAKIVFLTAFIGILTWFTLNFLPDVRCICVFFIGIVCMAIITGLATQMAKRTSYGNELFEKINGWRRFIKTVEKTQLETLLSQNPNYFYDILPYAYALGVLDVWCKQFKTLSCQVPEWFTPLDKNNKQAFTTFLKKSMQSVTLAMSTRFYGFSFEE